MENDGSALFDGLWDGEMERRKRQRHSSKKSTTERIWALLIVLGFLALIVGIAFYYSDPENLKWFDGLWRNGP